MTTTDFEVKIRVRTASLNDTQIAQIVAVKLWKALEGTDVAIISDDPNAVDVKQLPQ